MKRVRWFDIIKHHPANDDNPRSPGASHLRCDWCGDDHRRWFIQRVCTNCAVAPRGSYGWYRQQMLLWGAACAACGVIGFLAGWVTG